jgi:hypothetical protein
MNVEFCGGVEGAKRGKFLSNRWFSREAFRASDSRFEMLSV